jgi:hypothetical protein
MSRMDHGLYSTPYLVATENLFSKLGNQCVGTSKRVSLRSQTRPHKPSYLVPIATIRRKTLRRPRSLLLLGPANIECLSGYDFVFVSVDDGPSRHLIVDWLSARGIPYVDCGMGLERSVVGLSGFVRITGTDRKAFDDNVNSARRPVENAKINEYRKQAQISEFNALNAAMAVIRFKQYFKMLDRLDEASSYLFDSATLEVD